MSASRMFRFLALSGAIVGVLVILASMNETDVTRAGVDTDGDGYDDATETFIGTDPLSACSTTTAPNDEPPPDAWPPDFNDDTLVWLPDIIAFMGALEPAPYNARFDLNTDGRVTTLDMALVAGPVYGTNCPNPYTPGPTVAVSEIAIDMDTTGNDALLTLGADIQDCGEIHSDGTNTIDIDVLLPAPGVDAGDGIAAWEFFLDYDPAVVSVTAEDQNFLLADTGSLINGSGPLPDTSGSWRSGALEPTAQESGPGVLTRITLTGGVTPGTSSLTLTSVVLLAASTGEIAVTTVTNATVLVDETCVSGFTPQPAIFSVRPPDIVIPPVAVPCEASALLTLPTLSGFACSRPAPTPDLLASPAYLGLDVVGAPGSDNLDAVSLTELSGLPLPAFHFSVDSASHGISCAAPDAYSEAGPTPPGEAHGDIFTDITVNGCNSLYQEESVQGLNAPGSPGDDMDALTEPAHVDVPTLCPSPIAGWGPIPCPAFSVDAASPLASAADPHGVPIGPADLLVPPGTPAYAQLPSGCPAGGKPCVAVSAASLGLVPGDDLDALCWFDRDIAGGIGNGLPDLPQALGGTDQYYFSLARLSPTLTATGFGPADILAPRPGGVLLAVYAGRLGLLDSDNLDALKCLDPDADGDGWRDPEDNCPFEATPWWVPPGDGDCDGFSNPDENWVGTLPDQRCGDSTPNNESPQPWPTDNNDDTWSKLDDVLRYIPVFNRVPPPALTPAEQRFDLNADGKITLADVLKFIPFFNKQCT